MEGKERGYRAVKLFAVVNGKILEDLEDNVSATYTRIHYLLNGIKAFPDTEVKSIPFEQMPGKRLASRLYNNLMKTAVAIKTAKYLISERPTVFFAYPYSLTTVQNKAIFHLCELLKLDIVLDIHDTIEQAQVIGTGKSTLSRDLESYCFRKATIILALNQPMWNHLENKYKIDRNKRVVFVPNAYEETFCKVYPNRYNSIKGRFNICYLGGLTKNRGIEILFEACEELLNRYPYVKLYLFGSYGESITSELKDTIENSDFIVRKQIPRKDLPEALEEVDLFVMPYNPKESYMNFSSPTKLFEYIGTAKPILCTKCESLLEIGKYGGIIYVNYDAHDLEKKAEMLILHPEIREKQSEELIKIRQRHTWKERAKRVHEALESQ
jgi:glycosyltransferase involved in cell wall biosynthesis